jgi:hypothetical protein
MKNVSRNYLKRARRGSWLVTLESLFNITTPYLEFFKLIPSLVL